MADLNSVMQAIAGREAQASQHAIDLGSLLNTELEIRNQARDLVTTDANGKTPEMVRQEGIAALQAQERTIGISRALGLSNDLTTDLQYKLALDQAQAVEVARQQGAKINQLESVGLTDNPIEYLLNQWMLPDEYAKYDGAVAAQQQSAHAIQNLQASTANAAKTSTLIQENITKATIEDQLKASEASIKQQQLKYTMDNLQATRQYTKDLFALDAGKLERAKDVYVLQNQAEQQEFMREQRRALAEDRKAKVDAELAAKTEVKERQESALKAINLARTKRGEAPYGMDVFTKGLWEDKGEIGKQIRKDYEAGVNLEYGAPVRMGTATETAKLLSTNPIQKISDQHEVVAKTVISAYQTEVKVQGRKPEQIEQATEERIKKAKEAWELGAGGENNPLKPLPVQSLDLQKAIASNPAWQAYRKVVTTDGNLDTKDLGSKLKKILQEKIATPEQVGALLSAIGHTSAEFNNVNTDLMYLTGTKQERMVVPMVIGKTKAQEMATIAGTGLLGLSPLVGAPVSSVPTVLQPSGLGAAFPIKTQGKPVTTPGFGKLAIAQAAVGGTLLALGTESEERIDLMAPTSELVKKAYKMLGQDAPEQQAQ